MQAKIVNDERYKQSKVYLKTMVEPMNLPVAKSIASEYGKEVFEVGGCAGLSPREIEAVLYSMWMCASLAVDISEGEN